MAKSTPTYLLEDIRQTVIRTTRGVYEEKQLTLKWKREGSIYILCWKPGEETRSEATNGCEEDVCGE